MSAATRPRKRFCTPFSNRLKAGLRNGLAGMLLHRKGEDREAVDFLLKAHRLKPDPRWAVALGECYHALGQDAKARRYLEEAIERDARNPDACFLLGRICLAKGYGALAERYLLLAREAGKTGPDLHRLLGRAFFIQRKFIGPVRVMRLPGKHQPGDLVEGHVVIEDLGDGTCKVCSAFSALREGLALLRQRPRDADALEMVARGWLEAGREDLAEKAIRALARVEPRSARSLDLQARLLLARGRTAQLARLALGAKATKALGSKRCAGLLYRAALEEIAAGHPDEAAKLLEKALAVQPASLEALRSLAELARTTGQPAKARAAIITTRTAILMKGKGAPRPSSTSTGRCCICHRGEASKGVHSVPGAAFGRALRYKEISSDAFKPMKVA